MTVKDYIFRKKSCIEENTQIQTVQSGASQQKGVGSQLWGTGSVITGIGSQTRGAGSEIRSDPPPNLTPGYIIGSQRPHRSCIFQTKLKISTAGKCGRAQLSITCTPPVNASSLGSIRATPHSRFLEPTSPHARGYIDPSTNRHTVKLCCVYNTCMPCRAAQYTVLSEHRLSVEVSYC